MAIRKKFKAYCNENYLRFNLTEDQVWKNFDLEFGQKRTDELNQLFVDRYKNPNYGNPYNFCKNFKETSILMYFQSDFFLENSIKILELFKKIKCDQVLELGSYNGILLNYIANLYPSVNFTGIDLESKIVEFAKERFKKNNLSFFSLDYKNSSKLKKKFDFIFTLFGIEDIPKDTKLDKFNIRDNKDYSLKYNYFDNFFKNIASIIHENALFCPLIRIPNLNCLLSFLDASSDNKWILKDNKIDCVESRNSSDERERIPYFLLEYNPNSNPNDKIDLNNFFEITNDYRKQDSLIDVFLYQKNKSNFIDLIKNDKIFYSDDQNTLFYEIYKNLGTYMMFMWATNSFANYQEYKSEEELKESFFDLTGKSLEL